MATTPVDPAVAEKMSQCLTKEGVFGNPASHTHSYGWKAAELVQQAREQVAALINADAREIIWTSGATESDNLAIIGAARFYQRQGKHIITMSTEHKAVLDACRYLASQGFEITYLNSEINGMLDLQKLKDAIRRDTILISIMHVNNETGVIQDIAAIGEIAKQHGVLFHVDAAQSAGKIPIDLQQLKVDLMSFSGHKIYGPKGIGALFVRRNPRVHLEPLIYGGGHERGMRSGTLATHQIVGMGEAFAIAKTSMTADFQHLSALSKRFWSEISALEGVHLNGDTANKVPFCMNIYFAAVNGESLMLRLRNLAFSAGSACNSANPDPSHVLLAMGLSREIADNSLRISFGRFTTEEEIDYTIAQIVEQVTYLRKISPIWQSVKNKIQSKIQKS
jgi:cysteine desulfurase